MFDDAVVAVANVNRLIDSLEELSDEVSHAIDLWRVAQISHDFSLTHRLNVALLNVGVDLFKRCLKHRPFGCLHRLARC